MGTGRGFAQEVDAITVARARRGDPAALDALYRCFGSAAYTLALRLTGRRDAAEDVVQEAFVKAIEKIRGFRGDAPVGAWLKRLVANAAIDRLRADRRLVDGDAVAEPATEDALAERHDALGLLSRMPAAARTVLVLHAIEGYSHAELAELFGRSESYSKSILSRATQRLRAALETEEAQA